MRRRPTTPPGIAAASVRALWPDPLVLELHPPDPESLAGVEGIVGLVDALARWASAEAAAEAAREAFEDCLPGTGLAWAEAIDKADPKAAAKLVAELPIRHASWWVSAETARSAAFAVIDAARDPEIRQAATRERTARLAELDAALTSVTAPFGPTDPDLVQRAASRQAADELRLAYWSAQGLVDWLHGREVPGQDMPSTGADHPPRVAVAWPYRELTQTAVDGLCRLWDLPLTTSEMLDGQRARHLVFS